MLLGYFFPNALPRTLPETTMPRKRNIGLVSKLEEGSFNGSFQIGLEGLLQVYKGFIGLLWGP